MKDKEANAIELQQAELIELSEKLAADVLARFEQEMIESVLFGATGVLPIVDQPVGPCGSIEQFDRLMKQGFELDLIEGVYRLRTSHKECNQAFVAPHDGAANSDERSKTE